jgi:hypothetical protein
VLDSQSTVNINNEKENTMSKVWVFEAIEKARAYFGDELAGYENWKSGWGFLVLRAWDNAGNVEFFHAGINEEDAS